MLKCSTLIIKNNDINTPWFTIGDLQLSVNDDGSLKTKDKDGKEKTIDGGKGQGTLKHLEININDTKQSILNNAETQLIFDEGFADGIEDTDFAGSSDNNSIKILSDGHYFVSFSITLDMYSSNKTTVGAYIKINDGNTTEILEKSQSYLYFQQASRGYGSINNSFIYDAKAGDEITIFLKTKEGTGNFYTVPQSTNFNIFKII